MRAQYPVRRVMALFMAHEALPQHPEFVLATVKPLVEAELTTWFSQLQIHHDGRAVGDFVYDLNTEARCAIAERRLAVVTDFKVLVPDGKVSIIYSLIFGHHPIEVGFETKRLSDSETYQLMTQAYHRLALAAKAAAQQPINPSLET